MNPRDRQHLRDVLGGLTRDELLDYAWGTGVVIVRLMTRNRNLLRVPIDSLMGAEEARRVNDVTLKVRHEIEQRKILDRLREEKGPVT